MFGRLLLPVLQLIIFVTVIYGIPRRGNEPWTLILCKFADLPYYEPKPPEYFRQWLTGDKNDSIETYFSEVSNGVYTINGSNVVGWITLPYSQKDVLRMVNADSAAPIGSDTSFDYFDKVKEVCVQVAAENNHVIHRQRITVINSGTTAVYGKKNGVLLSPQLIFSSVLTHEMVHSFFIGHSYSDRKIKIFPYAMHGGLSYIGLLYEIQYYLLEYDDRYDLQSTANAYMHRSKFGMSGPGLNGAHLDFLGWLPMDRMLYFGRDGRQNYTLRLSSISVQHNETKGWLLIMIPYDRNDPRNLFTIELRTPNRFDKGIAQPSVLIHRVQKAGGSYYSVLLSQSRDYYELTEGTEWVTFLEPDISGSFQTIRVTVRKMYTTDADVTITSTFEPEICRLGELRKMVLATHYGVNYVCIPRMRSHMGVHEVDLQRQYFYRNFYSLRATYGANECKAGYVWRAIDEYDYVCVHPHRQENAQQQALFQAERRRVIEASTNSTLESTASQSTTSESITSTTTTTFNSTESFKDDVIIESECLSPYVPRNAFLGDNICVTEREQYLTNKENESAVNLLKYYEFFNGVDTVGP